jgi:uncharacterized protein (DUF3084 family)
VKAEAAMTTENRSREVAAAGDGERVALERERAVEQREDEAAARERHVERREDAIAGRWHEVATILDEADDRDTKAEARDLAATRRDVDANLNAFVNDVDDDEAFNARNLAKNDRAQSRLDRLDSKEDRTHLADVATPAQE